MAGNHPIVHPVRLRIAGALSGRRELTTAQLHRALPDVSQATLYRQVAILLDSGLLEVTSERRVRGAVERTYRLVPDRAAVTPAAARTATVDDHRAAFGVAMAALLAEFGAYVDHPDADPAADLVGYRQHAVWLSPREVEQLITRLRDAITPALTGGPEPAEDGERRRYVLSPVLFPAGGEEFAARSRERSER
ncbi:helix-turn-helix domain-containing protein [Isoptericola sp. NPDC057191]|uniref:helix-turn-helix domain-containing protein n=1 Tax=Isoptericola sp. NPDC057191 TaxID=3346041 RepID=UPI00363DA7F8